MSYFQPEPLLVLDDKASLIDAIKRQDEILAEVESKTDTAKSLAQCRIKSLWLIDLINEISQIKFVSNNEVKTIALQRLGLDQDDSGFLSLLVYNAEAYKKSDGFTNAGYVPLTQDMIEQAFKYGAKVEVYHFAIVGGAQYIKYPVREVNDKVYAFIPKCKKQVLRVEGQPAKIVF